MTKARGPGFSENQVLFQLDAIFRYFIRNSGHLTVTVVPLPPQQFYDSIPEKRVDAYDSGCNFQWFIAESTQNGPGIEEKTINRIFEPFFSTKPIGEGTGLGLSVFYMIVTNNHQGTMEVESEVGKKTKFIIRLPLKIRSKG